MNREELRHLVAELLQERSSGKGAEALTDLTKLDLRKTYLVEHPQNGEAFLRLKAKTPARLGMGRAGLRRQRR